MKSFYLLQRRVLILIIVCTLFSCKKSDSGNANNPQSKATLPTVTTVTVSLVNQNIADGGGTVTEDGGATVTARGVCYSTSTNPTIANSLFTKDGSGTGAFTSSLTTLQAGMPYYARAYATNSAGTAYGNQVTFSTIFTPTVVITGGTAHYNRALVIFSITATGFGTITASGICWSIAQNPTIGDNNSADGTMNNLTVNTTYYVRAYAINSAGTGYSTQATVTTGYEIGQAYQGGLIFYIDATKLHGLIVTSENQSNSAQWDNTSGTFVSPGAYSASDGAGNTSKIVATLGNGNNAAAICKACRDGGYSDWFLPAANQLVALHAQANVLYPNSNVAGAFGGNEYWSSTESSSYVAFAYYGSVAGGQSNTDFKTNYYAVRAIRAF